MRQPPLPQRQAPRLIPLWLSLLWLLAAACGFPRGLPHETATPRAPARTPSPLPQPSPSPSASARPLCLGLRLQPALTPWFNSIAQPNDVAAVDSAHVDWLADVARGRRLVRFASVREALTALPALQGRADIVGYDLEHWPQTPADEQADPVGALQRLAQAAHARGLTVSLGPDLRFTQAYGEALAPHADRFVIQAQRLQNDPDTLQAFLAPLTRALQTANPQLEIVVQLRVSDTQASLWAALDALPPEVRCIALLYDASSPETLQAVVAQLRAR